MVFNQKIKHIPFGSKEIAHPREMQARRRMIDIHAHVLFGIDDGATDIEMSLDMLRMASAQGITDVFCTSHGGMNMVDYAPNLGQLRERIAEEGIPVRIHRGCEVYCTEYLVQSVIGEIQSGSYPTLADSPYFLLEFSPYEAAESIASIVRRIGDALEDKRIVIAHVERCKALWGRPDVVDLLEEAGCLFQVNVYSLEQESNERMKAFARALLAKKRISFLGSDAHRVNHRPPAVEKGIEYVYGHCDRAYADAVCFGNALQRLLERA